MSRVRLLSLLAASLLLLPACRLIGIDIGCEQATVEAQPAEYEPAADELVMVAKVTNADGQPVPEAPVHMAPLYTPENPGGIALTAPHTDERGVARGTVPIAVLERQATAHMTGEWHATFLTETDLNGVLYCRADDYASIPDEVVEQVNAATDEFLDD